MMRHLLAIVILLACTHCRNNNVIAQNQQQLSLLVFADTVIAYNGTPEPGNKVPVEILTLEKEKFFELIEKNKKNHGNKLEVQVKVSSESGVMEYAEKVMEWLQEQQVANFRAADPSAYDAKELAFNGIPFSELSKPSPLKLTMPKDEPEPEITIDNNVYTLLIVKDSVYAYRGKAQTEYKRLSLSGDLNRYISSLQSVTDSDKLFIFIKPTETADYRDIVDVLDQMINVKRYYISQKLTQEEQAYFNLAAKTLED
jgi:biopolymer transport protein ExbD